MIRLKLFQAIFFIPCAFIDTSALLLIHIPVWIFTGVGPTTKEGYIEWLIDLPKHLNK
jgi:hypothetical protein